MTDFNPASEMDDDSPELTDADVARMRPAREVLPADVYAGLSGEHEVVLTVSEEVVDAFKADGDDWRGRMAAALTEAASRSKAA